MDLKEILNSVKVEGNKLILEYEFYPYSKNIVGYNNTILFTYIDGLENIIYTAKNKKTFDDQLPDGVHTVKYGEKDSMVINKNDLKIDINRLKEYIKSEV